MSSLHLVEILQDPHIRNLDALLTLQEWKLQP